MPTDRELMQQALVYMDDNYGTYTDDYRKLIEALRARLAQPEPKIYNDIDEMFRDMGVPVTEPEPVAWMSQGGDVSRSRKYFEEMGFADLIPLYTIPPKREFIGLTDEEVKDVVLDNPSTSYALFGLIRDDVTVLLFRRAISDFIRAIEAKLKGKNT